MTTSISWMNRVENIEKELNALKAVIIELESHVLADKIAKQEAQMKAFVGKEVNKQSKARTVNV